ncbi:MAG: alpha/beta hydrolase, partial [Gammaproteobacteria bacterium]|nr:alpha/beta hydrolase [Gammaproteobacteria bacterium]
LVHISLAMKNATIQLLITFPLGIFVWGSALSETDPLCTISPGLPMRADYDSDLIICGEDLPADIELDGLKKSGIQLVYKQALKECNWDDERPGFHLVLNSPSPARGVPVTVADTRTGTKACTLELDFMPARTDQTPSWANAMPEDSVKMIDVDGISTRYFEMGDGPPLVLVHGGQTGGFNNHARKWKQNFPGLAEHFRVIALDRLGQGGTDNLKRTEDYSNYYTLDAIHLRGFIEALGLEDVTLVGHSQGGWPVTRVALDRPDLVHCLVNVGTVMVPDDGKLMLDALNFVMYVAGPVHPAGGPTFYSSRRALLLRFPTGNNVTDELAQQVVNQHASPKIREAMKGMASLPPYPGHPTLRLNPAHPIFTALRDKAHDEITEGDLKALSLVIFGEKDPQVPVGLGRMFNEILESSGVQTQMVVVKDAGHSPHAEFPDDFNKIVTRYCGSRD